MIRFFKGFPCFRSQLPHRPTLLNVMSKDIAFDTLFETISQKQRNKENKYIWISVLKNCKVFPCFRPQLPHKPTLLNLMSKNIAFDTLFDTVCQKQRNKQNKYNWISILKNCKGFPCFRLQLPHRTTLFYLISEGYYH